MLKAERTNKMDNVKWVMEDGEWKMDNEIWEKENLEII